MFKISFFLTNVFAFGRLRVESHLTIQLFFTKVENSLKIEIINFYKRFCPKIFAMENSHSYGITVITM